MQSIHSSHNPRFQHLLRLAQGKRSGKDRAGQDGVHEVLLEGIHLCQECLRHIGPPYLAVFDQARLAQREELQALHQALQQARQKTGLSVLTFPPHLIKKLSHVPAPQGVFFCVQIKPPPLPPWLSENSLWLDGVQDPGNVGTLLRTAAAVGVTQVFASDGCADLWSPKVLRAAQGAHFALHLFEHVDLPALHRRLRVPLLASSLTQADSLYAAPLPKTCAWVFGSEGQGVSPALLALAERRIRIPQSAAVESLNVTVAAALCLFEQHRQHGCALL